MNKAYLYLANILSAILIFFFVIIFVTENTNFINENYRGAVVNTIEKNINKALVDKYKDRLDVKIGEIKIKWNGLAPKVLFNNVILTDSYKDTKKVIISADKLIASLNIFDSILNNRIIPKEFNIVRTDLKLTYNRGKLFFRDKNINELKDYFITNNNRNGIDFSRLSFRITDSSITLKGMPRFPKYKFKKINLALISKNNNLKIFTTFNHIHDDEFVHIAADLNLSKNKDPSGIIYSKGVNLNLKKFFLQPKNTDTLVDKLNYTLWSTLKDGKIIELDGKIKSNNLLFRNRITNKKLVLTKFNSKIHYDEKNYNKTFLLSNFDVDTKNHEYRDNHFFLKIKEDNKIDFLLNSISVNDFRSFLNLFPKTLKKNVSKQFNYVQEGEINQIKVFDFQGTKNLQFSFFFKDIKIIKKGKKFSAHNLSGYSEGNYNAGIVDIYNAKINLKDKALDTTKDPLDIKAVVYYQLKKNNLYVKTKNLTIAKEHKIDVSASLKRGKLNFRVITSGKTESLMKTFQRYKTKFVPNQDIIFSGKYTIDLRAQDYINKKNLYGVFEISNLTIHDKSKDLSITDLRTRINFNGIHAISEKTEFYFDGNKFNFSINTDVINRSIKYYINTSGKINTKLVKRILNIDNKDIVQGSAFSRINIYVDPESYLERINFNLISELKGVSVNIFGPLKKSIDEKKLLNIAYAYDRNKKDKVKVFFDKYKMLVDFNNDTWLLNIDSPYIKGKVNWPLDYSKEKRVLANLVFLDMNKFSYPSEINDLPFLHLKSRQIRIGSLYLDNVDVLTSPDKENLIFEKFIFNNVYLSMKAKGKWLKNKKGEKTFFDAKFKSDDLGKALKGLGYDGLVKKGKLDSRFVGSWTGSPEDFKFSIFDGSLKINSKNGEVLQVNKQTQAIGQLLGLFSIASIPKRLSLDFSDFFSSGLRYDDMDGQLIFKSGKADTEQLVLKGSFGEMRLKGETDLIDETYNQTLLFIPDLSSTSLITGTVIGGPIGAVASIFYDKFLKEIGIDTNKLAGIEYSVKGPWRDPEVKVTESFKPILN